MTSQSTDENNDFGNYKAGTKSGYKFEDKGADGTYDAGTDPRLDGWTIKAFADKNGDGILDPDGADDNLATVADNDVQVASVVTGTGAWRTASTSSASPPAITSSARWPRPPGPSRRPAAPARPATARPTRPSGPRGYAITVSSQSTDENNNFGNYKAGTKSGYKFEDKDADGTYDAGTDPRLDGWTIRPSPTRTATASSDPDGADNNLATVADNDVQVASVVTGTGACGRLLPASARPRRLRHLRGGPGHLDPVGAQRRRRDRRLLGRHDPRGRRLRDHRDQPVDRREQRLRQLQGRHEVRLQVRGQGRRRHLRRRHRPAPRRLDDQAFADKNGDGILDPDGADNILATVADNDVQVASVVTGTGAWADGFYQFSLAPGNYVICEVAKATWTQSAPSGANTTCDCSAITALEARRLRDHHDLPVDRREQQLRQLQGRHQVRLQVRGQGRRRPYDAGTDPRLDGWTILAFADKNGDGILDPDGADNDLATVADDDSSRLGRHRHRRLGGRFYSAWHPATTSSARRPRPPDGASRRPSGDTTHRRLISRHEPRTSPPATHHRAQPVDRRSDNEFGNHFNANNLFHTGTTCRQFLGLDLPVGVAGTEDHRNPLRRQAKRSDENQQHGARCVLLLQPG